MSADLLEPLDSVTLAREGLKFHIALDQPTLKHGVAPRTSAVPIGLKISFGPDDYSWLNEKEMKVLVNLMTTGIANAGE